MTQFTSEELSLTLADFARRVIDPARRALRERQTAEARAMYEASAKRRGLKRSWDNLTSRTRMKWIYEAMRSRSTGGDGNIRIRLPASYCVEKRSEQV